VELVDHVLRRPVAEDLHEVRVGERIEQPGLRRRAE
jgi:hypothetical protein